MPRRIIVMDGTLARMQGQAWRSVSRARSAVDRLQTREQIDQRGDLLQKRGIARLVSIARTLPESRDRIAVALADFVEVAELDQTEDELCTAASADAADCAEASREISTTLDEQLAQKPAAAMRGNGCGAAA